MRKRLLYVDRLILRAPDPSRPCCRCARKIGRWSGCSCSAAIPRARGGTSPPSPFSPTPSCTVSRGMNSSCNRLLSGLRRS
eukprot:191264-Pyramimonas_sp.AAC.1